MNESSPLFPRPFSIPANQQAPLTEKQHHFINTSRRTLKEILTGKDERKLLIIGPCSVHETVYFFDYALKFKELADQVADQFFCVLRAYVEKPRTCLGWRGFIQDPFLDESYAIEDGIKLTKELFSRLTDAQIPLACELLEPLLIPYYQDYISWGCIGARTCTSPAHRHLASNMPFAVGFKNSLDGNLEVAVQGLVSAKQSHVQLQPSLTGPWVIDKSCGNSYGHLILRGSRQSPNYTAQWVNKAYKLALQAEVLPRLIIDCAHDNSQKITANQQGVFHDVVTSCLDPNYPVCGLMLESFIYEGSQPISKKLKPGLSITDPCLSFDKTKELVINAYKLFKSQKAKPCFC